ncbi:MAG: glycosyltransferase family 4 protein [Bacteroidetes bacterium]|nr:glycosyltransferase family 4 protein [Bacteroidota bacterium]
MSQEKKRKPKVLLTNGSDIYSGGEYFVLEFGKKLKERGYDVTICCHPRILLYEKAKAFGINLFPVDFPVKGEIFKFTKIIYDYIKKNKIDIVHTNNNYDRTAAGFAAKFAGAGHITMNHSYHSISHNITQWLRNQYCTNYFLVDGFCTKELLASKDKIDPEKIKVIHLGIEPDSMRKDAALRKKVRDEFNISDDTILFGNTGRLVEFKGQEYLVKSFAQVAKHFDNIKLMIVGNGHLEQKLKDLTNEFGLNDNIIFPGFRDDMQAVYSAFDVYLHSSVEGGGETFPFSVLYSLAQGIPAVVTDVGDVAKMIDQGETGFFVADKNPEAMAEKIIYLLNNKNHLPEFGSNALKLLHKKFTLDIMFDNIIDVYNKIPLKKN